MTNDNAGDALVESRSLRASTVSRIDVLDKVKALSMLPDGMHVTTEMVAKYYAVSTETVEKLAERNREELESNGYLILRGADLRQFVTDELSGTNVVSPMARSLALFTRRAVLNVGQLLRDSEVARRVRQYLLNVEETATPQHRLTAAEMLVQQAQLLVEQERRTAAIEARIDGIEQRTGWYSALGFAKREGLPTNHRYLNRLGRAAAQITRVAGEEPSKIPNELFGEVNSYPEWALSEAAGGLGQ